MALALFLPLIFPAGAAAWIQGYPEPREELRFYLNGGAMYRFPTKVNGGGTLGVVTLSFFGDVSQQVTEKLGAGLAFTYEFHDYEFSGLKGFFVSRPWNDVQRLGVSVPLFYALADDWRLILIPTVQYSGESGARFGDSLVYGGLAAVTYRFSPTITLGLGLAGYYNLATATFFPVPIVKIKLSEQFRLGNPFHTSPAGPAGLELTYIIDQNWDVGLGGAYRTHRFRLDSGGPIPNGIGEYRTIPVFARVSYKPLPALKIDAYGGASFLNKIYVDDRDGDELYRTKQNVAPLIGVSLSGTF
jgi:hypothetical protein|uniref:DUF6268 domain-containing protein n=1 Tax=Desulfobacca acetoxidans TaxID=60893 RepID=A0A7C3UZQ9_9BACT